MITTLNTKCPGLTAAHVLVLCKIFSDRPSELGSWKPPFHLRLIRAQALIDKRDGTIRGLLATDARSNKVEALMWLATERSR